MKILSFFSKSFLLGGIIFYSCAASAEQPPCPVYASCDKDMESYLIKTDENNCEVRGCRPTNNARAENTCINLQNRKWEMHPAPIFRDKISHENYEVASDSHVFEAYDGTLRMLYSGAGSEATAIKMSTGNSIKDWQTGKTIIGAETGHSIPISKETAFYFHAPNGEHQIYFIGYADEETYESEIYLAYSDKIDGPYTVLPQPVVPRGEIAGEFVHTITSPSIVKHEGLLYLVFIGWDDFQNVSQTWSIGAVSRDNGRSWHNFQKVEVPIVMEGQLTKTPDGKFVVVNSGEYKNDEAIFLGCASHPFGPYRISDNPILRKSDTKWDKDEITAPQIFFDYKTRQAYMFYTGSEHKSGWWILMAKSKN